MDQQGSFEIAGCGGGRTGQCVRQMSEQTPIYWTSGHAEPYTLLGDLSWRNYTVSSDVLLEKSGYAQLIGRGNTYNHQGPQNLNGYYFRVTDAGAWSIRSNNTSGNWRTLASGNTAALGTGRWHNLSLTLNGSTLTAAIDGTTVGTVSDSTWVAGQIGYGTGQGVTAQFDNLTVTPVGTPPAPDRRDPRRGLQPVPGRQRRQPGRRRGRADLGLQRRRQPAVDAQLEQPAAPCTATSASTCPAPRPVPGRGS